MAPEVSERCIYDGKKADIFSLGVVLFTIVKGIYPFLNATKGDHMFNMLMEKKYDKYWEKVKGEHDSDDFKSLVVQMLSYQPEDRPTIDEIRNHPWLKARDHQYVRNALIKEHAKTPKRKN